MAERIRTDPRVTVLERTNLRYIDLAALPDQAPVQLATLDLSFISVLKVPGAGTCAFLSFILPIFKKCGVPRMRNPNFQPSQTPCCVCAQVLPAVCSVLTPDAGLIVLIKPQFEAGRGEVWLNLRYLSPMALPSRCCRGMTEGYCYGGAGVQRGHREG